MSVVLALHVDQFGREVADGRTLVDHLLHGHIGNDGDMFAVIHHDMVVAVELAADARQVRQRRRQFAQVETVDADGQVLQVGVCSVRVSWVVRVDFHTRLVVGYQVYLGLQAVIAVDEQVVVLVQVELLVGNGGALGHQLYAHPLVLHRRRRP